MLSIILFLLSAFGGLLFIIPLFLQIAAVIFGRKAYLDAKRLGEKTSDQPFYIFFWIFQVVVIAVIIWMYSER